MGLTITRARADATNQPPGLLRACEVAALLGISRDLVTKLLAPAVSHRLPFGRRGGYGRMYYDVDKVVDIIAEKSGHTLRTYQLDSLITTPEAGRILEAHGIDLHTSHFSVWYRRGQGPRQFKIGKNARWLRQEVEEWAAHLASVRGISRSGPNVGAADSPGARSWGLTCHNFR